MISFSFFFYSLFLSFFFPSIRPLPLSEDSAAGLRPSLISFSLLCLSFGNAKAFLRGAEGELCREDLCNKVTLEERIIEPVSRRNAAEYSSFKVPTKALKVSCRPSAGENVAFEELCLKSLPPNTRVLEISNVTIPQLEEGAFEHLPHLKRLDLRRNGLSYIEAGAFRGLWTLKRLDLSFNNLVSLDGSQLAGLSQLFRLKVGHNPLKELKNDLLKELSTLRALELTNTSLNCDCHLQWLVERSSASDVPRFLIGRRKSLTANQRPLRILGSPACSSPSALKGMKLKKVPKKELVCDSNSDDVTTIEIDPLLDQVVFAGDSLRLQCKVTGNEEPMERVWWKWGDKHLLHQVDEMNADEKYAEKKKNEKSSDFSLKEKQYGDDILIKSREEEGNYISFVDIREVSWSHSGEWSCIVQGKDRNNTRSISIYVIHHDTKYCPVNITTSNKGNYSWPRTVAQVTVDLPCQQLHFYHSPSSRSIVHQPPSHAHHVCNKDGQWESLNISACSFTSETTRALEQFANTHPSSASSTLEESVRALSNFTQLKILKESEDISFLTKTIEKYIKLFPEESQDRVTAKILINIIGTILSSSKDVLQSAEAFDGSCTRLLKSLWLLVDKVSYLTRISIPHLSIMNIPIELNSFTGIACLWSRTTRHSLERHLVCKANNYSTLYTIKEELLDARIRIVPKLLPEANKSLNLNETLRSKSIFQMFLYDSSNLFPFFKESSWKITSPVIGVRVNGVPFEPGTIYITIRSSIYSHNILPAIWNVGVNTTRGNWTTEGCKIIRVLNSLVSYQCDKLSHFGLLQDMASLYGDKGEGGAPFRLSSPGVYVGSTICCLFLMASIATWGIQHHNINTMSKNKHSFINTWIAILFLVAFFTVGIYQTETPLLCQIIGIVLHYLTMCVVLWIIVSVTNLYKKVSKTLQRPFSPDDPLPDNTLPPKPMLRFYLVGWGISLILCGISSAVNLRHYNTYSYCFLAWNPSLVAFYAPCAALVFILTTFFMLTQCILKSSHGVGYSEATGNTETTELELLDAVSPTSEHPPSHQPEDELSVASQTSSLSLLDGQHSPSTQLRAHVVTLLLFVLTWASAAIATASPFSNIIPYHTTIFSVIYAICSSSLGIFIFVFFCLSRSDVLEGWKDYFLLCSSPVKEDETQLTVANNAHVHSNVVRPMQSNTNVNNQIRPSPTPGVPPSVRSVESSNTHPTNKSSSLSQSVPPSHKTESMGKASNALHILNLGSLSDNIQYAPEIFYNPKQTGVAKRFFQKQRLKQMMKQNNLDMNRPDSDCNSSTVYRPRVNRSINSESDVSSFDPSCLGVSNKINNTNIHVDGTFVGKQSSKNLTPELLCVLGPPKDTCNIVCSTENDQHQWPITYHYQCSPNTLRKNTVTDGPYPRHPYPVSEMDNNLQNIQNHSDYNAKSLKSFQEGEHLSLDQEFNSKILNKIDLKEHDTRRVNINRCSKSYRSHRTRRKRSRSRGSEKEDRRYWSEEEGLRKGRRKGTSLSGASPVESNECAAKTSVLSVSPNLPQSDEVAHKPSLSNYNASQLEWIHLLNKRTRDLVGDGSSEDKLYFCDKDFGLCSDGDSTEGGGEYDNWDNDWCGMAAPLQTYSDDLLRGPLTCVEVSECRKLNDGDSSSIATSLVPGVDTSPPASLPVSDSPFDSPMHKYYQNTPDNLSLDSGSILSPVKSHFSSCDNASAFVNSISPIDDVPNFTLTLSTPVNTPTQLLTPTDASITPVGSTQNFQLIDKASSPVSLQEKDAAPASSIGDDAAAITISSANTAIGRNWSSSPEVCFDPSGSFSEVAERTQSSSGDSNATVSSRETDV